METMREIILQELNEELFSRKHVDKKIRAAIEANPTMMEKVHQGVGMVQEYMSKECYASKMERIAQLQELDLATLVMDIFVGIAYSQKEELFTGVTTMLASRLGWDDKTPAITTMAELVAVLCDTDAFDIYKASKGDSLMVQSRIPLDDQLLEYIQHSTYLPPMVCEPLELTHNFSSGYLTHNDSLILGSGNHHDGDICLDVLNTMNKVAIKMDTEFLSQVEEEPTFELDTQDKIDGWNSFKEQSYYFYQLLNQQGNRFYFNHAVDKRGRIYCRGYHLSTQGTAFKKAMLEFADEELIDGVPAP